MKITLPGPYLLTRSMWVGDISRAYRDQRAMADDVVRILREELLDLERPAASSSSSTSRCSPRS